MGTIITGKNDIYAAKNITDNLRELVMNSNTKANFFEVDNALLITDDQINQLKLIKPFSFLVVPSKHKSESAFPCLTAHFPGNVCEVTNTMMGGESKKLSIGFGSLLKTYIQILYEEVINSNLNIEVVIEQDHHGPSLNTPIMFVEIGSDEQNWKNQTYGKCVANCILKTFEKFDNDDNLDAYRKFSSFIAIGNTHYPKKFTELLINSDYIFSHVFSKYVVDCLDKEMLQQAINKSVETVKGFVIDKKSLNASQREILTNSIRTLDKDYEIVYV
ncbi:MAG: D-aminoacyl-tRNA deacylase [Candidatus Micrarchaeota archaeon]|nr:D-aminoacyl-tRNA deacylase [Candidatus Micrarchaeota archaeon]